MIFLSHSKLKVLKIREEKIYKLKLKVLLMNLIELAPKGKFVFVGDTHGDVDTSKFIIRTHLTEGTRIVFLGDYVDRGPRSKENVNYLLEQRKKHPRKIYLLQGNHERYLSYEFNPADFWYKLEHEEALEYEGTFRQFPLMLSVGDIIATHSGLPNVKTLKEVNKIKDLSEDWHSIVWEDVVDKHYASRIDNNRRRLSVGDLKKIMKGLSKKLLIRSHDPKAPEQMFEGGCLTLFTSRAYPRRQTIAIADFTKKKRITSVDDLIVEEIR